MSDRPVDWGRLAGTLELAHKAGRRLVNDGFVGMRDQLGAKWRDVLDELEVDVFDERDLYVFVAGLGALDAFQRRVGQLGVTDPRIVLETALAGLVDFLPPAA